MDTDKTPTIKSPLKAIAANCIDCSGGVRSDVKLCHIEECPLHAFRLGKNPYNKRKLTDEQRAALSARMKGMHRDARKKSKDD